MLRTVDPQRKVKMWKYQGPRTLMLWHCHLFQGLFITFYYSSALLFILSQVKNNTDFYDCTKLAVAPAPIYIQ